MILKQSYTIHFRRLIEWLLQDVVRSEPMVDWIFSYMYPAKVLHDSKLLWYENVRYKLAHNNQVIYLEKVLNEHFNMPSYDPNDHQNTKAIYIGPGDELLPKYLFVAEEEKPLFLPKFLHSKAELDAEYSDFIVWVPASRDVDQVELRALVEYYNDTRTFKIETY